MTARPDRLVRETVISRLYGVTLGGVSQEIQASSAADLGAQLRALGSGPRATALATLVWADDYADATIGPVSIVALGRVVQQRWGRLPVARPARVRNALSAGKASDVPVVSEIRPLFGPENEN